MAEPDRVQIFLARAPSASGREVTGRADEVDGGAGDHVRGLEDRKGVRGPLSSAVMALVSACTSLPQGVTRELLVAFDATFLPEHCRLCRCPCRI
ncbi:hypothetical protein [Streptomyces shenzhenensis]|uniref:hypothetical protein n=1 Tax=Streptomyces shenzhenensis TaxID=943815 RepID=UPI0033D6F058